MNFGSFLHSGGAGIKERRRVIYYWRAGKRLKASHRLKGSIGGVERNESFHLKMCCQFSFSSSGFHLPGNHLRVNLRVIIEKRKKVKNRKEIGSKY